MADAREYIKKFLTEQTGKGVKRSEIARSLFNRGYSSSQVALVLEVHPKTAHAFKINFSKAGKTARAETGHPKRDEIKNYLKGTGGAVAFNLFYSNVNAVAGVPYHSKAGEQARKKAKKAEATA
jgi:hypothetical protein